MRSDNEELDELGTGEPLEVYRSNALLTTVTAGRNWTVHLLGGEVVSGTVHKVTATGVCIGDRQLSFAEDIAACVVEGDGDMVVMCVQ